MGNIVDFSKSNSVKSESIASDDWVLDLEDIEKESGRLLRSKTKKDSDAKSDKHIFKKGNVLYSKLRPYLNKVIIAPEDGFCTSEILVLDFLNIYNKYAQLYLMSPFFVNYAMSGAYGVKMPRIGSKQGNEALFPIPPLAEQHRIVAKIEELLPKIEEYGKAQDALDKLNEELPEKLKKSILQDAIQGLLVPQDPKDEPASVLLEKIRKEKKQLVKEGVLKKKEFEEIPVCDEDISFKIPKGWECVKLSFLTSLLDGEKKEGNHICLDAKFLRGKTTGNILSKGKYVKQGDSIILVDGENSGEVFTVPCEGYMGSTFKQLWVSKRLFLPYVLYYIGFYKDILRNSKKGAAIPHLNKEIFNNLIVGIPPLAEQHRIVAKIEQLFNEIDKLKA